jgi:hypothetical protein
MCYSILMDLDLGLDLDLDLKKHKEIDCTTGNAYLLPHLLIMKFGSVT